MAFLTADSSFDTSQVKIMTNMFEEDEDLTDLNLSSFDFSNVEEYEGFLPDSLDPDWRSTYFGEAGS